MTDPSQGHAPPSYQPPPGYPAPVQQPAQYQPPAAPAYQPPPQQQQGPPQPAYQPPPTQVPGPPPGYGAPQQQQQQFAAPPPGPPPGFVSNLAPPQPQGFPVPSQYGAPAQPQQQQPTQQLAQQGASPQPADLDALFGTVDPEAVKKTHQIHSGGDWHKFNEGMNVCRFCPPRADSGLTEPWVIVYKHRIDTPGVDRALVVVCPKEMLGHPCPICELVDQYKASPSPTDQQRADKIKAKREVIAVMVKRAHPELGPRKVRVPSNVYDSLSKVMSDPWQPVNFTHVLHGYDVGIDRTGTGQNDTRYTCRIAQQPSPLANTYEQMVAWGQNLPAITSETITPNYEQIHAQLQQAQLTGRAGPATHVFPGGGPQQQAFGQPGGFGQQQFGAPGLGQAPQQWPAPPVALPPAQPGVTAGMGTINPINRNF